MGGWSRDGCSKERETAVWAEGTTVRCQCDHVTPFTVILDLCSSLMGPEKNGGEVFRDDLEPTVLTTVCLGLSVACCAIVLLHTA